MAAAKKLSDIEQVNAHIEKLDAGVIEVVQLVRQIILNTDPQIGERIKWNNPSFYYTGDMKAFDPKEYKREIAVFNLFKGRVMLVFPTGAGVYDTSGLLQGDYKDGRRTIVFSDVNDVKLKQQPLREIILKWLATVEE